MKIKAPPSPEGLRPLFLAIARASMASYMAGCVTFPLQDGEDANGDSPDASQPDGALPAPQPDSGIISDGGSHDAEPVPVDAGDDDAGDRDGGEGEGWEPVPCVAASGRIEFSSSTEAGGSLSVYEDGRVQFGEPATRYQHEVVRQGSPCSGATNVAECEQQIAALTVSKGCMEERCNFAIVGAEGAYTRVDTRAELLVPLGSIDSVADAVLLAAFDGHRLCPGTPSDPRAIGTEVRTIPQGYELRITREDCSEELYRDRLTVAADGTLTRTSHIVLAPSLCVIGRRPAGLREGAAPESRTRIGAFLAQAAHLEAASVHAFYKLLRELRALGAPESLRSAALDAMLDEVRHARDVGELAHAYGAQVAKPEVDTTRLRSPFELALDNIGEGCVRETFGALQATYQAETAADPRVRHLMAQIAEDESRHAELAWNLQAWLEPKLSERERVEVGAERTRVLDALAADLDAGLSREECAALGFPTPEVSGSMLHQLSQSLFA